MSTVFLVAATIGGSFLLLQLAMSLIGFGVEGTGDLDAGAHDGTLAAGDLHDHASISIDSDHPTDLAHHQQTSDHHHSTTSVFKFLTLQTLVAFLAFFGIGGLASLEAEQPPPAAALIALLCGGGSMFLVGYATQKMRRLHSEGTIQIERATGACGRVYVEIPGEGAGAGKVMIRLQDRTVELCARTSGPTLVSGTNIQVCDVIDGKTVNVVAAGDLARTEYSHSVRS